MGDFSRGVSVKIFSRGGTSEDSFGVAEEFVRGVGVREYFLRGGGVVISSTNIFEGSGVGQVFRVGRGGGCR